jgi:hypothetical protein
MEYAIGKFSISTGLPSAEHRPLPVFDPKLNQWFYPDFLAEFLKIFPNTLFIFPWLATPVSL